MTCYGDLHFKLKSEVVTKAIQEDHIDDGRLHVQHIFISFFNVRDVFFIQS